MIANPCLFWITLCFYFPVISSKLTILYVRTNFPFLSVPANVILHPSDQAFPVQHFFASLTFARLLIISRYCSWWSFVNFIYRIRLCKAQTGALHIQREIFHLYNNKNENVMYFRKFFKSYIYSLYWLLY